MLPAPYDFNIFSDLNDLNEKIASYFEDCPEVAAVYLFGSYARNRPRFTSDVDIAVILVKCDKANLERLQYMLDLARMLRKDIHPVIMNTANEELLTQIFSKGRCIQVNDAKALSRFRSSAFAKIAEFGYYRESLQTGLIRKLREEAQGG